MTSTAGVVGKASSRCNNGSSAKGERPNGRRKPRPKSSNRRSISSRRLSNGRHISGADDDAVRFSCLIGSFVTVSAISNLLFGLLGRVIRPMELSYFAGHDNCPKGQYLGPPSIVSPGPPALAL